MTSAAFGIAALENCGGGSWLLTLGTRGLQQLPSALAGLSFSVGRYWLFTVDCHFGGPECEDAYYNWHTGEYRVLGGSEELNIDSPQLLGSYMPNRARLSISRSGRRIGYTLPGQLTRYVGVLHGFLYGFTLTKKLLAWVDRRGVHAYLRRQRRELDYGGAVIPQADKQIGVELSTTSRYLYETVPIPSGNGQGITGTDIYRGQLGTQ